MVQAYKVCKPYITNPLDTVEIAYKIYTVSLDKANKMFKLMYGVDCPYIENETLTCYAISMALDSNALDKFIEMLSEATNGNN